jgi:hypothetical protein
MEIAPLSFDKSMPCTCWCSTERSQHLDCYGTGRRRWREIDANGKHIQRSVRLEDYEIRTKEQAWELLRPRLPAPVGAGLKPLDAHTIRLILGAAGPTCYATRSRLTCMTTAPTYAAFKCTSATRTSVQRKSIRTSPSACFRRLSSSFILMEGVKMDKPNIEILPSIDDMLRGAT